MNLNTDHSASKDYQILFDRLNSLEQRLARLESDRNLNPLSASASETAEENIGFKFKKPKEIHLESNIGEFGLAWLGNIVLFFGITFMVQYLQVSGFKIISSVFGYFAIGGIFFLAYYFRKSNSYMAKIFDINGYLLVYYVTLKLHFFTSDPLLANKTVGLFLLLVIIGILLYLSAGSDWLL